MGDSSNDLRQRLVIRGKGEKYDDELLMNKMMKAPYQKLAVFFEEDEKPPFKIQIFWKPATKDDEFQEDPGKGKKNKNKGPQSGWDYHAILFEGKVIAEYYNKLSGSINEFEKIRLLQMNGGGRKWVKANKEAGQEKTAQNAEEKEKSLLEELKEKTIQEVKEMEVFPYTHEFEGSRLRVQITRNGLFFSDELAEEKIRPFFMKKQYHSMLEKLDEQRQGVDESLSGF